MLRSVEVQYRESYLGPPSNTRDKHEVACGKVVEINPPHIEGLFWDFVDCICHGASWVSNPFEVLSCLLDHLLSIPLTGFSLDTLLIVVYPTFDYIRLVTV